MNIEERVTDLERELRALKDVLEPGLRLYNSLIPYGLERYMLPLLRAFGKEFEDSLNGTQKASIWNLKWTRWAAIFGIIYVFFQILMFVLVLYNTFFGVHHTT